MLTADIDCCDDDQTTLISSINLPSPLHYSLPAITYSPAQLLPRNQRRIAFQLQPKFPCNQVTGSPPSTLREAASVSSPSLHQVPFFLTQLNAAPSLPCYMYWDPVCSCPSRNQRTSAPTPPTSHSPRQNRSTCKADLTGPGKRKRPIVMTCIA